MTVPRCCLPLLLARPDSPLKGKGLLPRPLWPSYCPLLAGKWIRHQACGFIQGGSGQNLARQIAAKENRSACSSPAPLFFFIVSALLINRLTQAYKGRQSEASRMSVEAYKDMNESYCMFGQMAVNRQRFTSAFHSPSFHKQPDLLCKDHEVTVHVKAAVWGPAALSNV